MQYWGITDPGCIRTQNQDSYQVEQLGKNALLCVVCDGMGGAKSGNVASTLAVDVFVQEVKRTWVANMAPDRIDQFEEFDGMGTTLVAALISGDYATIVNVGDSRAYSITSDDVRQLTTDHSLVQMMIARGELTPEKARNYPGKNLITRAIGTESVVECDIFHRDLADGECLLLCTDGLSNLVDEQEILFEVVHGLNKQSSSQRLLEIAKKRGAPDNVTCVLIQI